MKKKLSKLELALKKIAIALQAYINEHIPTAISSSFINSLFNELS